MLIKITRTIDSLEYYIPKGRVYMKSVKNINYKVITIMIIIIIPTPHSTTSTNSWKRQPSSAPHHQSSRHPSSTAYSNKPKKIQLWKNNSMTMR